MYLSASLVIELPITLEIARVVAPHFLANLSAPMVSAVSPDWLINIASVCESTNGFLYLNSEAISTSTGILHKFSKMFLTANPACIAVPQATIYILFILDKKLFEKEILSISIAFLFSLNPIVSLIETGCSCISFSIKSS